jgi:hypothetical protein
LLNVAGIGSQSGASLAFSGVSAMVESVSEQNADDSGIAFISTPAIRQTVEHARARVGLGLHLGGRRGRRSTGFCDYRRAERDDVACLLAECRSRVPGSRLGTRD